MPVTPAAAPSTSEAPLVPAAQTPAAPAAVEEYEIEIKDDSPLSDEDFNAIVEYAGKHNLSKEAAEALIAKQEGAYKNAEAKIKSKHDGEIKAMKEQIAKDPEFSGEKAPASWASVKRALDTFGDPEMLKLVNTPGVGDNIALARFLKKLGDAMSPDTIEGKGAILKEQGDPNATAKAWYPDFFQN